MKYPVISTGILATLALSCPAPASASASEPCAPLLAPAADTPEAAIARAWSELLRDSGVVAGPFPNADASLSAWFAAPVGAGAEYTEAIESLGAQAMALLDAEMIDEGRLRTALDSESASLRNDVEGRHRAADRARQRRARPAVHSVSIGAPIVGSPIALSGGDLAVATRTGVSRVSIDGNILKSFETPKEVRERPLLLEDGSLVVPTHGGAVYFLSPEFEETARFDYAMEPGQPAHRIMVAPALHGEIAVAEEEHLTLINCRAQVLRKFTTVGPQLAPPLQLRNGNWVTGGLIENRGGFIEFLSTEGKRIALHTDLGTVASTALQIPDGNVVIGSGDGFVRFFSERGALLGIIKTGGSIYSTPVLMPDGEIAVGDIRGVSLLSSDPNANAPARRSKGPEWNRGQPLLLPDRKTLVLTTIGNRLRGWNLESDVESNLAEADKKLSGEPILLDDDTIVVGDLEGNLIFVDVPAVTEGIGLSPSHFIEGSITDRKDGRNRSGSAPD